MAYCMETSNRPILCCGLTAAYVSSISILLWLWGRTEPSRWVSAGAMPPRSIMGRTIWRGIRPLRWGRRLSLKAADFFGWGLDERVRKRHCPGRDRKRRYWLTAPKRRFYWRRGRPDLCAGPQLPAALPTGAGGFCWMYDPTFIV